MQTGLICLEVVSRLNQQDLDARSVMREFAISERELTQEEMLRIAKALDFKAKVKGMPAGRRRSGSSESRRSVKLQKFVGKYPLPAIFVQADATYAVLLKVDAANQKLLVFDAKEKKTKELTFADYEAVASGEIIVLSPKVLNAQVKFGFKWFYSEILKYRRIIGEVLAGSFVVQLFGLVTPLFTQVILDKVIVHHSVATLDVLAVAFVFVICFDFLLNIVRNYIFVHTANKIDAKLGAKLFKHLFSLPFVYFESRRVGVIAARVRELDTIREFITNKSVSVIVDLFFSLVFVVMMLLYSVQLTFVVLGFVAIVATIYVTVTPELRERLEGKFQMAAQSNSYLVESITGVQTVKSLAIEGSMQKKWEDHLGNYLKSSFKLSNMSNVASAVANLCQKGVTIAILYLGVKLVMENKLTIGQLIAFQMFANQFTTPVMRLVNLWNEFQQALLSVDRIGDILNHPVEVQTEKAITLPQLKGAIRIENLCFRYNVSGQNVLNSVNLDIRPGTSIGLVGRSGSGKSTITKLIQRLYIASEGSIYIDGIDVRHMNPLWLRHNIGVVLQENYLFSGTIRENIALPRQDAPMELIIEASKLAGAHDFIAQLPEGYDTMVGERGSSLSGGQKQRIAIARALITNPRILIFDEATAALDYESERIVQQSLEKIKQGRTVIIIAHRLSSVASCDTIVAMDAGKIVEQGPHKDLIARKGYYAHLHSQQGPINAPAIV